MKRFIPAVAAATALAGCSVQLVPVTSVTPVTSSPAEVSPSTAPTAPSETSTFRFKRSYWLPRVTTTRRCDGGDLSIEQIAQVVRVGDGCARVTISASSSTVLLEGVDTVEVSGVGNVVLIRTAQQVTLTGSTNIVAWDEETPMVTDQGTANLTLPNPEKE